MKIDTFFTKGKSHRVCQDFTWKGETSLVVADGCSGSSHTDTGARLLALSAAEILKKPPAFYGDDFFLQIARKAGGAALDLGLPADSIDSTLLCARCDDRNVEIFTAGDGFIVAGYRCGTVYSGKVEYKGNLPFYASYFLSPNRLSGFLNARAEREVSTFSLEDKKWIPVEENFLHFKGFTGYFKEARERLAFIALFSDGADSFYRSCRTSTGRYWEPVGAHRVIEPFLTFKKGAGEFVVRRARKVLKEFESGGIYHSDDLSIGVIHFD